MILNFQEWSSVIRRNLLLSTLVLSAAYIICGKLSLLLAIPPGYASAIFPPAGIALAAAFIAGKRTAPGILLGSFLLNLWIGYDNSQQLSLLGCGVAFLIACASLLQAIVGGVLLRKVIGYPAAFDNLRDVLSFQILSPVICLISATLSVSSLMLLGFLPSSSFMLSWLIWWGGDTLGVLVLLPLTMVVAGEPRALWRKRLSTVAIPMIFVFSMLVILYVNVSHWEQKESLVEFRLQSQRVADTIQARFDEQESLLEQTKGLFAGDDHVTADEFQRFTQQALKRFPMIKAIEWAPRIESVNRQQFETAQQAQWPDFKIRDRNIANTLQAAGERPFYFPITYVEPRQGNQIAFGFDIVSTRERSDTVQKAIRTGRSTATPPLHLLQSPNLYGFLLLHAVQNSRSGDGVVLTVIRADEFLEKLLPKDKELLWIRLTDVGTAQEVYSNFPKAAPAAAWQQKLIFGQREFLFETAPSPIYLAKHRGWQSALVLAAGVLVTGLLGSFLILGTGYTARVEALVEEKVAELSESTEKLTGLYELSPLGIALTDMQGRYIDFNAAFQRISGYSAEELQSLDYWVLTPRKYEALEAEQSKALKAHGRYGPYEKEYLRKDGSLVPISLNGLLLHGKNGEQYIWSIVEDISSRKISEQALRDSEERWKFALEGAGDGVWDWNLQTGELFLSKQEMEILGYAGEEARQTTIDFWVALQHPQDLVQRKVAFDEYLAGNTPIYTYEFRTQTSSGRWKWILARGMLVSRSDDGQPLRMIGTHTDIDDRKRKQVQNTTRATVMEMLARGEKLRHVLDIMLVNLGAESDELAYVVFSIEGDAAHAIASSHIDLSCFESPICVEQSALDEQSIASPSAPIHPAILNIAYLRGLNEQAQTAGFELCWSEPIVSGESTLEGMLVSFRLQAAQVLPDLEEQHQAANVISIAMQHERSEEQLLLANSVYVTSSEAIMVVDTQNHILAVNPAFEAITGFLSHEVTGRDPKLLRSDRQTAAFYEEMWQTLGETGAWRGELWNQRKDGSLYPVAMSIDTIHGDDAGVLRRIAVFSDITVQKMAEEQVSYLAHHDLLTNLPNRLLFVDRLSLALVTAQRSQARLALLYVDLDQFKPVNDNLGHAIGDKLLQQVASRMLECVRESDTVARIGGDEFVVILPAIQSAENARRVAEKIRVALENVFEIEGHAINISSSIGGALYPDHATDEDQLMQHADHVMYLAKKNGRNAVYFYGES